MKFPSQNLLMSYRVLFVIAVSCAALGLLYVMIFDNFLTPQWSTIFYTNPRMYHLNTSKKSKYIKSA